MDMALRRLKYLQDFADPQAESQSSGAAMQQALMRRAQYEAAGGQGGPGAPPGAGQQQAAPRGLSGLRIPAFGGIGGGDFKNRLGDLLMGMATGRTWQDSIANGGQAVWAGRKDRQASQAAAEQANQTRAYAVSLGIDPQMAAAMDPQSLMEMIQKDYEEKHKPPTQTKLGPGDVLFEGGKQIASVPAAPQKPDFVTLTSPDGKTRRSFNIADPQQVRLADYYTRQAGWIENKTPMVNIDNSPDLPAEYAWNDPNDKAKGIHPLPGSDAERKLRLSEKKVVDTQQGKAAQADLVMEDIDRIISKDRNSSIGVSGFWANIAKNVPGTAQADTAELLSSIKANVAFDKLQDMRQNSPTGGALGSVSDQENKLLQGVLGSLEQSQSDAQFVYNLKRLKNIYLDIVHGPGNGPKREVLSEDDQASYENYGADDLNAALEKYGN